VLSSKERERITYYSQVAKMQNAVISDDKALKIGLKIITENASWFLEYHKAFRILICITYSYVVRNLADYLSKNHRGTKKEQGEVVKQYKSLALDYAKDVALLLLLGQLFPALGKPQ
jgi:phage anti-repressor protein